MNNDLTSRSALLEALENDRMIFKSTITVPEALLAQGEHWRRCLESAPAVDAVPVVRCEKCKHTETDGCEDPAIYCKKWDRWEMPPDFYCGYGERRTDA